MALAALAAAEPFRSAIGGSEPGDTQPAVPALDTNTMYDESFSRRIDKAFTTAKGLSRSALPPSQFLFQVIFVIVDGIDAVAGAIWQRTNGESFELRGQH